MSQRLLLYTALLLSLMLPIALCAQPVPAQSPNGAEILPLEKIQNQADLDRTIAALDAALFDGYNRCDLAKFSALVDENVEFYHDQGGVTLGNAALTESIRRNVCGRTTRELIPGTLKAFPMKGFGAVEFASHRFLHPAGSSDDPGEAETVMLWRYKDGAWKVTRVLSYDHHTAAGASETRTFRRKPSRTLIHGVLLSTLCAARVQGCGRQRTPTGSQVSFE